MKALTVRQPWASLIVHGPKHIETRSKPTKIRGRIGIIAGKHRPTSFWLNEWADDGGLSKAPAPWNAYAGDLDRWFDAMESNDGNGKCLVDVALNHGAGIRLDVRPLLQQPLAAVAGDVRHPAQAIAHCGNRHQVIAAPGA